VTRGVDGTTAVSHSAGAVFRHGVSGRDFDEANDHVNTTGNPHGTTASDVGAVANSLIANSKGALITSTGSAVDDLAPGSNGQMLVADSSQTLGLRWMDRPSTNVIINGSFSVWQRGTSPTWIANNSGNYQADRWMAFSVASGRTVTRQATGDTTNLPFFQYCARVQRTSGNSATDGIELHQFLESRDSIPFAGKTATLSFYARRGADYSETANRLGAVVRSGTGTDQNFVFPGLTGPSALLNELATLTTTWQRFSYSFSVGSTATQLTLLLGYTPTGTASTNDWFEVTGVQLETGPVATPFEFEPFEATLRKCQRYYYRTTPGATDRALSQGGYNSTTTAALGQGKYPVSMRTRPTALEQTGTAANYAVGHANTTTAFSAVPSYNALTTEEMWVVNATVSSGLTAGQGSILRTADAAAYLAWSAEL
jgi:hypothetical protein